MNLSRHLPRITEYRYWSPELGCDAVRVSSFDAQGSEFYMIVEDAEPGQGWRQIREHAANCLREAIDFGDPPGEVKAR